MSKFDEFLEKAAQATPWVRTEYDEFILRNWAPVIQALKEAKRIIEIEEKYRRITELFNTDTNEWLEKWDKEFE
jgi:hypothetical protein